MKNIDDWKTFSKTKLVLEGGPPTHRYAVNGLEKLSDAESAAIYLKNLKEAQEFDLETIRIQSGIHRREMKPIDMQMETLAQQSSQWPLWIAGTAIAAIALFLICQIANIIFK